MSNSAPVPGPTTGAVERPIDESLRRRLLRWAWRVAAISLFVLALLLAAGFAWEQVASRGFPSAFPAPGQMVLLPDGRSLHLVVEGEGEPTLVLEAGAGGPYSDWADVIGELAETTRVIAYDRAGLGWSDPSPELSPSSITTDLRNGLDALGIEGTIVLVGHSIGGPYVRHYASVHPDQVAGMVFVDSSHEQQSSRMPAAVADEMAAQMRMARFAAFASRFGPMRAVDALGLGRSGSGGGNDARSVMALRSSMIRTQIREMASIEESMQAIRDAAVPFDGMPILVLSASDRPPSSVPPAMRESVDEMNSVWRELQSELAQLSSDSRHVTVPRAGHYIQMDEPKVVVEEIRAMIEAIRRGESLSTIGSIDQPETDPGF